MVLLRNHRHVSGIAQETKTKRKSRNMKQVTLTTRFSSALSARQESKIKLYAFFLLLVLRPITTSREKENRNQSAT